MGAEHSDTDVTGRMLQRLRKEQWVAIAMLGVGLVAAALVATMPQASLDLLMWRLWLPQILSAATPPIGITGRTLLALLALAPFVAIAAVAWVLPVRARKAVRRRALACVTEMAPSVRRADSHPDAPPRRPIRASEDLGPPLPIVAPPHVRGVPEPERPLPTDLDLPLAGFDPIALPEVAREPVRAVAPLVAALPMVEAPPAVAEPVVAPAAVQEQAELACAPVLQPELAVVTPSLPPADESGISQDLDPDLRQGSVDMPVVTAPLAPPAADASISSLLDRLERGARKKAAVDPAPAASLDDTLVMLRRLAAR
jgi:hypothetical protein